METIGELNMNNYELEKTIIAALLNDFDKAQSTYLQAEWFTDNNFKTIFEILNNNGNRMTANSRTRIRYPKR